MILKESLDMRTYFRFVDLWIIVTMLDHRHYLSFDPNERLMFLHGMILLTEARSLTHSRDCAEQDGLQSLEVTEYGIVEMVPVKVLTIPPHD
jgi:hypothetical protein